MTHLSDERHERLAQERAKLSLDLAMLCEHQAHLEQLLRDGAQPRSASPAAIAEAAEDLQAAIRFVRSRLAGLERVALA
ncbi:hypothetical protein FGE12_08445 [Aggregicoccus sp. 17bor-14]|uniref:hypothetical protein n=1 Tax=Myxococcaceae TaxID=31 RepID=UPI00129C4ECF|nr:MULTISPECIES: hypothetical protein [Myxococcaceae]MBF5042427.1 hypothetical protein [Simulacricoccus sp. 17bor-14]MRI88199.1 hypothetical protein [Aggregicoccus sp. 17bor-14]